MGWTDWRKIADRQEWYGEIVNYHLRRGWTLWYRAQGLKSKAAAVAMQNRLLQRFDYDWNIHLNAKGKR